MNLLLWIRPQGVFILKNPAPIKALLAQQGHIQPDLRAPMTTASGELVARLVAVSASIAASNLLGQ